jgi:sensor histidine kinase YesM
MENKVKLFFKKNESRVLTACILGLLLFALCFVGFSFSAKGESHASVLPYCSFQGQYRIVDGEWQDIEQGKHISATKGEVTLKGSFKLHNPETGEILQGVPKGTALHLYFNHINVKISVPGQPETRYSYEHGQLGDIACGRVWQRFLFTGNPDDEVTITISNPHAFGNESAVDDFLSGVSLHVEGYTEEALAREADAKMVTSIVVLCCALIILGVAIFSRQIKIGTYKSFCFLGGVLLSAGLYFLFSPEIAAINSFSLIVNTNLRELSRFLYFFFLLCIFSLILKDGKNKGVYYGITALNGLSILACCIAGMTSGVKFYDTVLYWYILTILEYLALTAFIIFDFKKRSAIKYLTLLSVLLISAALCLDFIALVFGWWEGIAFHFVFLLIFSVVIIIALRVIPKSIKESYRARELEMEGQALKIELEERKIDIMFSQIQPHFLYNTLNTIYHLCDIDVEKAKSALDNFADYLRNNINALNGSQTIDFDMEIRHVNTYLNLEKIRFGDELEIEYDLRAKGFSVPVLSIQPLVENAVKHGTSKKRGGGKVTISSREDEFNYIITVLDTGAGFDKAVLEGKKDSIGIKNVSQRLKSNCNGTLEVQSEPGVGTMATITIPKVTR